LIDINQFINSIAQDFQGLAQQHNIELTTQPLTKNCHYSLDSHWMHRALQNLIGNAVQYANSQVTLSVSQTQTYIQFSVEDDGKGIPDDQLKVIFEPFIKLDADRSREQGHFGLGLAISAKIIDWHQGEITAGHASNLSGASFIIQLPL